MAGTASDRSKTLQGRGWRALWKRGSTWSRRRALLTATLVAALALSPGLLVRPAAQPAAQPAQPPSDEELEAAGGRVDCDAPRKLHNPDKKLADVPDEFEFCFTGYISKFAPWKDPGTRTGLGAWGIPKWTIHRVDAVKPGQRVAEGRERPRTWYTVKDLWEKGLAPEDSNYRFSKHFRDTHANWYERGHLTQKYLTERMPQKAGYYTHNLVNAVPQRARFNKGPWLTLECYTGAWANENEKVWIISGPVFMRGIPTHWLRSNATRRPFAIAIPDAMFKIVAREKADGAMEAMAFLYPQDDATYKKGPWDPGKWLTTVDRLEQLTGERFLPQMTRPATGEPPPRLWRVRKESFDLSCRRFAADVF